MPRHPHPHPATSEIDYSREELAFLKAADDYRRQIHRPLTLTDVLRLLLALGYRRVHKS
jgi:hypothetical protein